MGNHVACGATSALRQQEQEIDQLDAEEFQDAAMLGTEENPHMVAWEEQEAVFEGGRLNATHPFQYERVMESPKADHGTYTMRWYKNLTYHLLHTGGFLRLATERGRVYWLAQNETTHTTPDWKIHFSIAPRGAWEEDIGVAWDILAALFMERCCEVGMKARYDPWQDQGQRGRELTVYVYSFDQAFDEGHKGGPMADLLSKAGSLSPPGQEHVHYLGPECEAMYTGEFWFLFIQEAERRLQEAGLVSAGLADGDLALPGCQFASLRNEAYVRVPNEAWHAGAPAHVPRTALAYPPNDVGWNGIGHANPFEGTIGLLEGRAAARGCAASQAGGGNWAALPCCEARA